jgi:hypothetical protein
VLMSGQSLWSNGMSFRLKRIVDILELGKGADQRTD